MTRVLKIVWFALLLWALGFALVDRHSPHSSEREVVTIYAVMVLSFPSGWLLTMALGVVAVGFDQLGIRVPGTGVVALLIYWLAGVAVGYLQWFVAVPRLIAKLRKTKL